MVFHIFRRDLRLADNPALNDALAAGPVLPLFFLDPRQTRDNPVAGRAALSYMTASLRELDRELTRKGSALCVIPGSPEEELDRLIDKLRPRAVFFNRDYTPFSRERDNRIAALCRERGVECRTRCDLLADPDRFRADRPYRVFTPFFKAASLETVPKPTGEPEGRFVPAPFGIGGDLPAGELGRHLGLPDTSIGLLAGGRSEALRLVTAATRLTRYEAVRDFPAVPGTSRLSAPLKFGTVSVREVRQAVADTLGEGHPLIRQLWWRDFFVHIARHFPHVFGQPFHDRYRNLPWTGTDADWNRYITGTTGFPLVDAGIRELLETGSMHNRVRMIVASFLVKDLHIDWRQGELFFARYLQDYDPAVNNGNWQWSASTGCDAQPWFRVFNPWLQQKRFDPDGEYVRRWVSELTGVPAAELHRPEGVRAGYPRPMVNHAEEARQAVSLYRACPG